jgi:RNA polymerase sigma-70 factor (ECF subfamily)
MSTGTNFEMPTTTMPLSGRESLKAEDEAGLVADAKHGSSAAIEQLVGRYEDRLFRLAHNITSNHEDAEEVVQNTFVKAFRNLATFRGDSRFYTWLVRIAMNEALMKTRGRRYTVLSIDQADSTDDRNIVSELEDWGPNPEERYSQEELRRILDETINELGPGHRIVFHLYHVEELSTVEIARTLGLSLPAVKSRLARARLRLRNLLDTYFRSAKRSAHSTSRWQELLVNCMSPNHVAG